ncbi:hypothetical protein BFJ69_g16746 [Fusarium oxysporum]|uniref:Uncharacterized protein n=1 Tax=Fusarium oxysporum TaxID=5507 RepID=A0A420MA97_FUSOX|nr:hypothetical protein BFJ69_g16746 [Fusarium oxysporum]
MSNVRYPTYILAPNWTFRPEGRIAIGNVLVDPLLPHRALLKSDPNCHLPTETATEKNWQLSIEAMRNLSLRIWTIFLEKISIKIGANRTHIKDGQFNMQSLDTVSLKDDLSDDYIKTLCSNPKVREFMRVDSLLCKPVYVVTGLKVAKGFSFSGMAKHSASLTGEAGGEVAPEASLGGGAQASSSTSISDQFESVNDIIFAYQLTMIKPKGWTKEKKMETSDFRKHTLLSDSKVEAEEKVEAERDVLEPTNLIDSKRGVQLIELNGDGHQRVSVVYKLALSML